MDKELAFVLINPYTIAKSRTGGVIARIVGRTDLDFVAARMIGPSAKLAEDYAKLVSNADPSSPTTQLISEYIKKNYAPDPATGRPRRVMMLLFEGQCAVEKIWQVTGSPTLRSDTGETIRDTYGDYIVDAAGDVRYFEPAVLVPPSRERASATLRLWAKHSQKEGGILSSAMDVPHAEDTQRTLVLLKPDNFQVPSARAGNIIDLLSSTGLRIVGVKKFCMTVAQAEEFYGPVQEALSSKFADIGTNRAREVLSKEFGFNVPRDAVEELCVKLGPAFATSQFESIVEFMTGYLPSSVADKDKPRTGRVGCVALVYEGQDAIHKIRETLGPTDPRKARPGSVRREFGSNIMVNAAHASDSPESVLRELRIIDVENDTIRPIVDRCYGHGVAHLAASTREGLSGSGREWLGRLKSRLSRLSFWGRSSRKRREASESKST